MKNQKIPSLFLMLFFSIVLPAQANVDYEYLPSVSGSKYTRSTPFIAWFENLAGKGYVEEEYLLKGLANVYKYVDETKKDWQIKIDTPDVPYVTRILVRKPKESRHFDGTVYVEILNATAGFDGDPIWQNTHDFIMQRGSAYVGITAKPVTVEFLRDHWGASTGELSRNRARYKQLRMPYFGQVWDIITDAAILLRGDSNKPGPLKDLDVTRLILVGYSQSAAFQVTYANHFHKDGVFDGYYLAGAGEVAKRINRLENNERLESGHPKNEISVDAPVIRFQTQTEVIGFGSYRVRQHEPLNPQVRLYEMAGGAHVDKYTAEFGARSLARDLEISGFNSNCDLEINPVKIGTVQSALLDVLNKWIEGELPPPSKSPPNKGGGGLFLP